MPDEHGYLVPDAEHRVEDTVRRSRFVTTVARAESVEEAKAFVDRIRAELPDATHHCWAFVAGPPGSTARVGMSDDGEPHGTAGRPMLSTLLHSDVGEIVAVCARWFGGVKLGTGGLSRAYGAGVARALETLPVVRRVERVSVTVSVEYADADAVSRLAEDRGVPTESAEYGERVRFVLGVPEPEVRGFIAALANATHGRAVVDRSGSGA